MFFENAIGRKQPLMNHSCKPNVGCGNSDGNIRMYANRNIAKGEELCYSYIYVMQPYQVRQADLKKAWKFECTCELCSLPLEKRKEVDDICAQHCLLDSDLTLRNILKIFELVAHVYGRVPPFCVCEFAPKAYEMALENGDLNMAKRFIQLAYDSHVIVFGRDDPDTKALLRYVLDPSRHPAWQFAQTCAEANTQALGKTKRTLKSSKSF